MGAGTRPGFRHHYMLRVWPSAWYVGDAPQISVDLCLLTRGSAFRVSGVPHA